MSMLTHAATTPSFFKKKSRKIDVNQKEFMNEYDGQNSNLKQDLRRVNI